MSAVLNYNLLMKSGRGHCSVIDCITFVFSSTFFSIWISWPFYILFCCSCINFLNYVRGYGHETSFFCANVDLFIFLNNQKIEKSNQTNSCYKRCFKALTTQVYKIINKHYVLCVSTSWTCYWPCLYETSTFRVTSPELLRLT